MNKTKTNEINNDHTNLSYCMFVVMMLAEIKNKKAISKKVCSETSFQREKEIKRNPEKHQPGFFPPLILLNKKCSKSLNDLPTQVSYELCSARRNDPFTSPEKSKYGGDSVISADEYKANNKIARRCILNLMMLNAWRRQKVEFKVSQEKIGNLSNKVEGFEMQVYVLRQLLNAEKKRVEAANDNIHDLQQKIEECNKEKSLLSKENENAEKNFTKLSEYCSQIENALRNQENDIITSKLDAENWEKQLEKEREKLNKMKREEVFLRDKIQLNEKVLILKTQQIEQLTQENKELQQKLDVQVPLWDETMAQVDIANAKLKELEGIKNELERALEEKEKEIKELKTVIASLEKRLQEEDEKNGLLGKSILEKSNELSLIQKKLLELSKSSYPWSGGFIKVASFCAKIPVACICTVGSLLLPSYRI